MNYCEKLSLFDTKICKFKLFPFLIYVLDLMMNINHTENFTVTISDHNSTKCYVPSLVNTHTS